MINFSGKNYTQNQNTHFMFNNFFFFENRAVYEIMWKNIVQPRRLQLTWMQIAGWIPKTQICTQNIQKNIAFPQQQMLHERASITSYVHCLSRSPWALHSSLMITHKCLLTLRLLMSYIYMELLVKPEMLTSYIYGPTFGNVETVSFYLLHNVSTLNQCREVSCVTFVCKHFAS